MIMIKEPGFDIEKYTEPMPYTTLGLIRVKHNTPDDMFEEVHEFVIAMNLEIIAMGGAAK